MFIISTRQKMTNLSFSDIKVKGQGQGHRKGQNHIFGNNFGCNEDRNMKSTPFCSSTKGPLTRWFTFDVMMTEIRQNDVIILTFRLSYKMTLFFKLV